VRADPYAKRPLRRLGAGMARRPPRGVRHIARHGRRALERRHVWIRAALAARELYSTTRYRCYRTRCPRHEQPLLAGGTMRRGPPACTALVAVHVSYFQHRRVRNPPDAPTLRAALLRDWPALWPTWRAVVSSGDTYALDPSTDELAAVRSECQMRQLRRGSRRMKQVPLSALTCCGRTTEVAVRTSRTRRPWPRRTRAAAAWAGRSPSIRPRPRVPRDPGQCRRRHAHGGGRAVEWPRVRHDRLRASST
jgi:hypothetical protein